MNQFENNGKGCLIAISSMYGCTEEIALKIKDTLDNSSVKAEIVKCNDKNQLQALVQRDLTQYSGVLLGSGIVVGKVHKNISTILKKLESTSFNGTKIGFYICCMKACNPGKIIEAKSQYLDPKLKKFNLKYSLVDTFGGKLDFSPTSPLKPLIKAIIKKIMLKDNPEFGTIEPKVYDFRDWQQINKFATSWLKIIKND